MKLRDVLPSEFFLSYLTDPRPKTFSEVPSPASRLLDIDVVREFTTCGNPLEWRRWPGKHKHVSCWWELADGHGVGWNENPSRGWSFPVIRLK